ncbi:MAG: chemotaxis protein CheW [Proteobacteria bacterium]|jgi:purine-binding chemotaxis protein CheW|nr:chemotaxis protein CheW [Pseudomonadota bacterium]
MTDDAIVIAPAAPLHRPAAADPNAVVPGGAALEFLCFTLGREEFGIDLHLVKQIVSPPPITFVPRTRSYFLGVISVRGSVVTLIDLRQLLGLDPAVRDKASRILLLNIDREPVGLMVDRVTQVRRVAPNDFETNPILEENPATAHVVGILRPNRSEQITVIDLRDIIEEALR